MNLLYVKTIMYLYPCVGKVCEEIDNIVLNKALLSRTDYSPCETQCERIIELTEDKKVLLNLKDICAECVKVFSKDELDCIDYKYFKQKPKKYYENFDAVSRKYFRKQIRIAIKFSKQLEKRGISDEFFEQFLLKISFVDSIYQRVKIKEVSRVNPPRDIKKSLEQKSA